ncbi:NUDIX domain-containing protein [Pseudanabaena galeata]|uniref:NUDIX domain-containing protein n=1 Tax=Pseudanabaena TaxID=1152 RepID=UPI00247A9C37|nr:NUDIX domain-containing protein [Pseudanabaena galeata]WGS75231.1 NUDIX domain-containing protein [Pseudanabaena galeata CCNP1313]
MQPHTPQNWQVQDRFLEMHSRWVSLIGEHLQDDHGEVLEYWRIEKADSVIVIPIQGDRILLPQPSYRAGIGQITLDFSGGRVTAGQNPQLAAIATLKRELGIEASAIVQLIPLNTEGWAINSSFSNQKLYGFVAHLEPKAELSPEIVAVTYPLTSNGVKKLLEEITCLQCRAVLLEWRLLNQHWKTSTNAQNS